MKHSYFTQGCEVGSSGSLSLRGTSINVGEGLRCGIFDGVNGIDTTASVIDGETKGTETENQLSAGVASRRNFGDAFFCIRKDRPVLAVRLKRLVPPSRTTLPVLAVPERR